MIIPRGDGMATTNFQRALDFIEEHITDNISLNDIAGQSGYSVPQFYRLFKRLTGDTIGEYVLRLRMSMAAIDLKETKGTVAEIAYKYGFTSHDVFTRGFKRVYGVLPNQYRQSEQCFPPLKQLMIAQEKEIKDECQMTFRVLHQKEILVMGMECKAYVWDMDGSVGRLWSDFLSRVNEIKTQTEPMVMYGICEHESCDSEHFTYMAAVKVANQEQVPEGMVLRKIRPQKFFQAFVPESVSIPDAYTTTTNYAKSLTYTLDEYDNIEVYEERFQDPDTHSFQLLVPIK